MGDVLVLVLNENFRVGILTDSQHEGLLHLLYKKDERRLVKNWRPISLLNTQVSFEGYYGTFKTSDAINCSQGSNMRGDG